MNLFKNIWFVICLIGNITQIYQISSLYFSFSVLTKVFLTYPKETHLPTLSVCFYIGDLIKWEELFTKYPHHREAMKYEDMSINEIELTYRDYSQNEKLSKLSGIISTLTSNQIMNLTEPIPEYVFRTILMNQTKLEMDTVTDYRLFWKPKEYLRECYRCSSFDNRVGNGFYNYHDVFLDGKSNGFAYELSFNETLLNRTSRALIMLHEQWHYPRSGQTKGFPVKDLSKIFNIKYIIYVSHLLPSPYTTNCMDYREKMLDDAGHCYERCARNESLKAFDKLFPGPIIKETVNYSLLSLSNQTRETYEKIERIKSACAMVCNMKNCTDYVIVSYLGTTTDFRKMILDVYFPNQPNIVTEYSPYLSLANFIVSTLSTIGFWIGVSLFDAQQLIMAFIVKSNKKIVDGAKRSGIRNADGAEPNVMRRRRKSSLVNHIIDRSQNHSHKNRSYRAPNLRARGPTASQAWYLAEPTVPSFPRTGKVTFETRHRLERRVTPNRIENYENGFEKYVQGLVLTRQGRRV